jgi:transketolase
MQAARALGRGHQGARGVDALPTCSTASRRVARGGAALACRKRVAIEAGVSDFWRKYVGLDGAVIGIDSFGASAPADQLFKHFGFTVEKVVAEPRGFDGARGGDANPQGGSRPTL